MSLSSVAFTFSTAVSTAIIPIKYKKACQCSIMSMLLLTLRVFFCKRRTLLLVRVWPYMTLQLNANKTNVRLRTTECVNDTFIRKIERVMIYNYEDKYFEVSKAWRYHCDKACWKRYFHYTSPHSRNDVLCCFISKDPHIRCCCPYKGLLNVVCNSDVRNSKLKSFVWI